MQYNPISDIIEDIKLGKPVVIVDDEDRENEGDVVFAAEKTTPELINFMAKHARGLVCMPITAEKSAALKLPMMVAGNNGTQFGTNFTVSIEAATGVTTGISAQDRARTILAAAAPDACEEDIVQPGHIFPIVAEPGGVLARAGHTEASTDLARLAGLQPAAVICEIMHDDGSMTKGPELFEFCRKHQLKIGTIADLIAYRLTREQTVHEVHHSALETALGPFELKIFQDDISHLYHYCFIKGQPHKDQEALIRVHVHEPVIDLPVFSNLIHRSWTIEEALTEIQAHPSGALVLLSQPYDSEQTIEKAGLLSVLSNDAAKGVWSESTSTKEKADWRVIGVGSQILSSLGYGKIRVLGEKKRYYGLSGFGITVVGFHAKQV